MKLSKIKGFIAYLIIIFCNSFVDLGHKILIQDTIYRTADGNLLVILSAVVNSFILLPYLLLFTPSGFISDKFPKAKVIKFTALAAIPLTLLITLFYYLGYFWPAFMMTLLLGVQSAINSPAKYGYIKELCGKETLARANALVQTLAIISILAGTFIFSYFFESMVANSGLTETVSADDILQVFAPLGWLLVFFSTLETLLSLTLPQKSAADPSSTYDVKSYFKGRYIRPYLKYASEKSVILTCIIGLAVFWSVNQVLLASYGAFAKNVLQEQSVLFSQGVLALGGIGLLFGANYAGKVSRGFIETGLIPLGTIGLTVCLFFIPLLTSKLLICLLFFVYGFFGGVLIVPLNALVQFNAAKDALGKVLAANNFIQNIGMFSSLMLTIIVALLFGDERSLLYGLFLTAAVGAVYTLMKLSQAFSRYILYFLVSKVFKLQVHGLDNIPSEGGILLLGNHVSFVDWAILQIACPRPMRFVMEKAIYDKWYLTWFFKHFKVIPIARGHSQDALETIRIALQNGEMVTLFPEGRLSMNGQIGTFYNGFERAAKDSGAIIIPFFLQGLWGSLFSRAPKSAHRQEKSKRSTDVTVVFGEPLAISATPQDVRQAVKELSIQSWRYHIEQYASLPYAWLVQAKSALAETAVMDDKRVALTNNKLLATVWCFNQVWRKNLFNQNNIGILLPASIGSVLTNLSILSLGKTIVNLNFTVGEENMHSAIHQAEIKTIITSRLFINQMKKKGIDLSSILEQYKLVYLEDERKKISKLHGIINFMLVRLLPLSMLNYFINQARGIDKSAALLFSSGSEGAPKGVMLSHRNLLTNIKQLSSVMAFKNDDVMLSSLPPFHAFGLTATMLMPLLQGIPVVCFPDPTNAQALSKLILRNQITLMCQTPTILNFFNKSVKIYPELLTSLRMVISGAEKLHADTREQFKQKFGLDIYEGYGATEVAPVASCNLPNEISPVDLHRHIAFRPGSVGLPLPGSAFRIVDPQTYEKLPQGEAGMVLIGGLQVMQGYLGEPDKTKQVLIKIEGVTWYISGDKGYIDSDGFLFLVDRYSRFAKVGGEMISLGTVEATLTEHLDSSDIDEIMILSVPDPARGESIVLLYSGAATNDEVKNFIKHSQLPNIMHPKQIKQLEVLPQLGTGKKDYRTAKTMLLS